MCYKEIEEEEYDENEGLCRECYRKQVMSE